MTSHPPEPTSAGGRHGNDFDALRLLGAVLVIVGHGFVLHGEPGRTPYAFGLALHTLGVAIFFAISGFLIMGSWMRRPALAVYATSRAARILPALVPVTLVCAFLLGPLVSTLPLGEYLSSGATWAYLANLVPVVPQYELPGVFTELPYPDAVNGSLWTLRVEFLCYLAVALLALVPARARPGAIAAAAIAAAAISMLDLRVADADVSSAADVLVYFGAGALLRFAPRRLLGPLPALLALGLWAVASALLPEAGRLLSWVALPLVIVAAGLASTPVARRAARFGDLSYGMYLWAFPVQQTLLHLSPGMPVWAGIGLVTLVSAVLALLSWHLVEAPAMRAKDRLPWMRRTPSAQRR
ncbi:acyltransferase family protein [Homoserinibacter sp. YIM 151385]|uniref:acyltransferase family protein n=1 Tax=Homoserinibacter sp. YIM 151385 TaxID=2985506 RepID=UPI0022F03AAA|nr:acyltransferase [Homoserinibacter sp. YIM 151385]WBU37108.1 acyltransferase [Homoserinibacter sp. YIM 151385]